MSEGNAKAGHVGNAVESNGTSKNSRDEDNNNDKKEPYVVMQINNLLPQSSCRILKGPLSKLSSVF